VSCRGERVRNQLQTMSKPTWSLQCLYSVHDAQIDDLADVLID
jgi:hypothetical protein